MNLRHAKSGKILKSFGSFVRTYLKQLMKPKNGYLKQKEKVKVKNASQANDKKVMNFVREVRPFPNHYP